MALDAPGFSTPPPGRPLPGRSAQAQAARGRVRRTPNVPCVYPTATWCRKDMARWLPPSVLRQQMCGADAPVALAQPTFAHVLADKRPCRDTPPQKHVTNRGPPHLLLPRSPGLGWVGVSDHLQADQRMLVVCSLDAMPPCFIDVAAAVNWQQTSREEACPTSNRKPRPCRDQRQRQRTQHSRNARTPAACHGSRHWQPQQRRAGRWQLRVGGWRHP
jgi:hypothetical protein